jgi:hypothetical protein
MNKHEDRDIGPKWREKWDSVDLVEYNIKPALKLSPIVPEGGPMNCPLHATPYDMDAVQIVFGRRSRKRGSEPFD